MTGTKVVEETQVDETPPGEAEDKQVWMQSELEGDQAVPVDTHIRMKQKLKGRINEKDDRISELEKTVADLQSRGAPAPAQTEQRPKRGDYDNDDDYYAAIDRFMDKSLESRYQRLDQQRSQDKRVNRFKQSQAQAVDAHYDRAAKLLDETGIDADLYKNADVSVRQAVDSVAGGNGDAITDQLIANMGDGSEKVVYFLGRNPSALAEFKSLLAEDKSGLKASIYLGQKKAELTKPAGRRSNAPPPGTELPGGDSPGGPDDHINAANAKRKYDAAHKKGDTSKAIKIKFKAKRGGVDTSGW